MERSGALVVYIRAHLTICLVISTTSAHPSLLMWLECFLSLKKLAGYY